MKLIDLEQRVIVPVVDESRGGMRYEMQMSVGELLENTLEDFEPAVVEAVPVRWIGQYMMAACGRVRAEIIREMLGAWMEREART